MGRSGDAEELADRWIAELDRHGVARAALIASIPGDEVSVAEAVAPHPTGSSASSCSTRRGRDAGGRLERALGDLRLRGICLFPAMHGYRLDDEWATRVSRAAADHGAAVFVALRRADGRRAQEARAAVAASICGSAIRSRSPDGARASRRCR